MHEERFERKQRTGRREINENIKVMSSWRSKICDNKMAKGVRRCSSISMQIKTF